MKVLIAPDKFKGSLTAAEVVSHLGAGLVAGGVSYQGCPLADGGDGSVAAARHAGYQAVSITVAGPTGKPRQAVLAFDGHTGVVEVANTCGLGALVDGRLEPLRSSSRGLGDAVRAAVELGAGRIVLALGGSASTDGGMGLLAALGLRFRDERGADLDPGGANLSHVHTADGGDLIDLSGIEIVIASDVRNPLTGPTGAAMVYGRQKGATEHDISALDAGLAHLVDRLHVAGYVRAGQLARTPGAGSAGGVGFAGLLLGGVMVSGADFFLDLLDFDTQVAECDLVITGEGRLDAQTRHGKLPAIVSRRSAPVPVIAVVGRSDVTRADLDAMGIRAVFALADLTSRDPAHDPILTAHLLRELGQTIAADELNWTARPATGP